MVFPLPRTVSEGSRLAIIAPAGPFDDVSFRQGVTWLEERYALAYSPDIFSKTGYFAGTDERRLCELVGAINDPDIDAIVCARGGFGTTRILPGLDFEAIRRANKMIVGFSDISALHAVWRQAGVCSVHATMVAGLGNASSSMREMWIDMVEAPGKRREWCLESLNGVELPAEGILTGGNLAVLGSLIGTPFCPSFDDSILFIEDVGERPYRIDRLLTTMAQAGWFQNIRGVVIGAFTEGEPGADGVTVDEVLSSHFEEAKFPVLKGMSSGHIAENEPLPFGANARIYGNLLEVSHDTASSLPAAAT